MRNVCVRTTLYVKCKSSLAEKGMVIIIGDIGTGKTTYAKKLFEEQKQKMKNRDCFEVRRPEEIKFLGNCRALYFDDIFGQHVENVEMTMAWLARMPKLVEMRRRVSLILTSRSDIYHRCKHRKGFGVLGEFVVELSCKELDSIEEENIARVMGLTSPLRLQPSDLSPLQQYEIKGAMNPCLQEKTADVVSTTLLEEYFEDLKKSKPTQYASLLLILVNNNRLSEEDLENQTTVEIVKLIGQSVWKRPITKIKEALRCLSTSMLMLQDHHYSFANNILFHIASKYFMKQHPDIFVTCSSIECLEILSPLFDTVNEVHSLSLSEKLAGQIDTVIKQKLFCLLKNERTLREFLTIISRDERLDLFFKSDFFWYICWCDSFLIIEMLLRKMSGRKEVIKNALNYCSDHFKSALQRYIEKDHPEEILSPTNIMQPPYEMAIRRVTCQSEDFPRFRYHYELMLELEESLTHVLSQHSQLKCSDFVPWSLTKDTPIIYIAGRNLTETKLSFISKIERPQENVLRHQGSKTIYERKKHQHDFTDFKERFPSCFIYFCDELETIETVSESLKMVTDRFVDSEYSPIGPFTLIVLTSEGGKWTTKALTTDCLAKAHVVTVSDIQTLRKHVTSALEMMMIEYISLVQKMISPIESSDFDDVSMLKTEIDAISNRIHKASSLPSSIVTSQPPAVLAMFITEECQDVLDRNPDKVYAYGFRPGTFYVQVSDHLTDDQYQRFQKDFLQAKRTSNFLWETAFEKIDCINIKRYLCPGSELYPDKDDVGSYGTLGGFAEFRDDCKQTVALTCSHVMKCKSMAHAKDGSELVCIGKCFLKYEYASDSADFALIKVSDDVVGRCQKLLVDHKDKPRSARVYVWKSKDTVPTIVYKKGATTNITKGFIVESTKYRDVLGDTKMNCAYLVRGRQQKEALIPFGEGGDSGSLVFQNDFSVDQQAIEVIAILIGDFEVKMEDSTTNESKSDRPTPGLKMCTSMEFVCEQLKKSDKQLRFYKTADVNLSSDEEQTP